jgi:YggT family protein
MIGAIDALLVILRPVLFGVAVALSGVATVDWLVRTQRINPFGRIARLFRTAVEPLMLPIEKRVVRAGGLPSHAPWWGVVVFVVAGVIVLAGLGFLRDQLGVAIGSLNSGPRGVYRLLVTWGIAVLQLAIVVRVVGSWIHFRPGAWYSRWSFRLSEPILRPIRNALPLFGTVDLSPIVGWFALLLVEALLLKVW